MHLETTTSLELDSTELEDSSLELDSTELEDSSLELDSTELEDSSLELDSTELEDSSLELDSTELEDSSLELDTTTEDDDSTEELDHSIVGQDVASMQTLNRTYSWSSDSLMLERAIFALCPSQKTNLLNSVTLADPGKGVSPAFTV